MQWMWVGVNLGCIDVYAVLEWANDMKLHVFVTKHKVNTYHEHFYLISWLFVHLELTPTEINDVTWNPSISSS